MPTLIISHHDPSTSFFIGGLMDKMKGNAGSGVGGAVGGLAGGVAGYRLCRKKKCGIPMTKSPDESELTGKDAKCFDKCAYAAAAGAALMGGAGAMVGNQVQKNKAAAAGSSIVGMLDEWTAGPVLAVWKEGGPGHERGLESATACTSGRCDVPPGCPRHIRRPGRKASDGAAFL
eukprot:gnl/TRDRNA2_/TRDRNA2_192165_c0_seq1.p2 gnl/TRDRNA2_/TRDRNA2_192165_c0~~gnl/TRDRNA2_/TRDRNA2_192165_c0_seq1.p2  ORF type:complete len:175 (+),score=27.18 gnl/TRDRNA2_/TRDRNA2_192165_c0_seq1:85-609(+)